MRNYLVFSSGGHIALLVLWVTGGALLSKPKMSYYAIDLGSSLPAGGPAQGGAGPAVEEVEAPAPKAPPLPRAIEERKLPANEVIRIKGKAKIPQAKPVPERPVKKKGLNLKAALAALEGQGKGTHTVRAGAAGVGAGGGTGGAGIVGDAGPAFPYPWYLKLIADKLNERWKPPSDFQSDTLCQIAFTIRRDGQVEDTVVEKPSGDSMFDQLAQRAVVYSNPLPPLPEGFPEDALRVHMKFVGKSL